MRRQRPEDGKGIKGKVMKKMHGKAGAGVPSANRITLLRDADGDGVAEMRTVFLTGLNSPFGMALIGNDLYVANTDAIVKFRYTTGRHATSPARAPKLTDLPGGDLNHHWTKNIIARRGRHEAVRDGGLQQQRGRERHGGRRGPRGDLGSRRGHRREAPVRHRPAQSQRHGVGAGHRHAVDRRERARRARQRPRA